MKRRARLRTGILVLMLGIWCPSALGSAPVDLSSPRTAGDERAGDSSIQVVPHTGGSADVYWLRDDSRIMHAELGASGNATPEQALAGVMPSSGVLRAAPVASGKNLLVWIERQSAARLLYRYALFKGGVLAAGPATLGTAAERTSDGTLGPRAPLIRPTPSGDAFVVWKEAAEPTRILSRLVHASGALEPTAEIEPEQSPNWGTEMAAAVSDNTLIVAWTKRETTWLGGVLTGGATGVASATVAGSGAVDVTWVAPPSAGVTPGNVAATSSPATTVIGWTETTGFGSAWSYRAQRLTNGSAPSGTPDTWASGTNQSYSGPPQTAVGLADSGLAVLVTHGFGRPTQARVFSPGGDQLGTWELTSGQVLEPPALISQRSNISVAWITGTELQSRSIAADGPGDVNTIGPVENGTDPPGAIHGARGDGHEFIGWHQARPDAGDPTVTTVGTFVATLEGDTWPGEPPPSVPVPGGSQTPGTTEPGGSLIPQPTPTSPLPPVCNGVEVLCVEQTYATGPTPGSVRKPCDPGADNGWVNVAGTTFACIFTGDIWDDPTLVSAKQKCVTRLTIDFVPFLRALRGPAVWNKYMRLHAELGTLGKKLKKLGYVNSSDVLTDAFALAAVKGADEVPLVVISSKRVLGSLEAKLAAGSPEARRLAEELMNAQTSVASFAKTLTGIGDVEDCVTAFSGP